MRIARAASASCLVVVLVSCARPPVGAATAGQPAERAAALQPARSAQVVPSSAAARRPLSIDRWTDLEASPGADELSAGAVAVRAGEWRKARRALDAALVRIRDVAPLDAVMAGDALLGRACDDLGDPAAAAEAYDRVVDAWKAADASDAIEATARGDEEARKERYARALLAVSEALYFSAEQKRLALDHERVPTYEGQIDAASMQRFADEKVSTWADDESRLVEDVARSYGAIASLEPTAPPRWAVRASARVGGLWGHLQAEFRAAPIPVAWTRRGHAGDGRPWADVRTAYYALMDSKSAPIHQRAKQAFQHCQALEIELAYSDDVSHACDVWLDVSR